MPADGAVAENLKPPCLSSAPILPALPVGESTLPRKPLILVALGARGRGAPTWPAPDRRRVDAVTTTAIVRPTSADLSAYLAPVAPAIIAHVAAQRSHP